MRLFDVRPAVVPDGLFRDKHAAPPGLLSGQAAALRRQPPLFYLMLIINVGAAAFTHLVVAPRDLTCLVPALLVPLCLLRVHCWLRAGSIVTSDRAAAMHRSFFADVDASRTAPSIIKTIVDLCRNLGFACAVEGVETQSQLAV